MKNNYSVYQHVTPDGMYYFGQTNNIKRRWKNNGAGYKGTALQPYIEKFGWDNIQHIVLFKDQTKENALFIENFLIETAQEDGVCINKNRSGLVSKEEGYRQEYDKHYYKKNKEQKQQYYQKNKEQILEQRREYREQNRDKIKQYYEQNKDKFREQNRDKIKQYYETNKEQIREQQKQYYEQNKDKWKEYRERNKDKIREYQRQYRKRKKLEKQLKEAVETPLF